MSSVVGNPQHMARAQEITDRTTTLVTDDADLVPLPAKKTFVTGWGTTQVPHLAAELKRTRRTTDSRSPERPRRPRRSRPPWPRPKASDQIVVTTSAAWNSTAQQQLVAALRATGKPVLVVALRDAYDIGHLDGIQSYLATYSSTPVAVESALG